ncbi:MAG: hypothetical protein LBO65_02955 [Spirochaetaceae bacterium]|jgi:hypothetical protein|nr:hypothetical protein [Spirochaetaceae bacterium]
MNSALITLAKDIIDIDTALQIIQVAVILWGGSHLKKIRDEKKMKTASCYKVITLKLKELVTILEKYPELVGIKRGSLKGNVTENLDYIWHRIKEVMTSGNMMPYDESIEKKLETLYDKLHNWRIDNAMLTDDFKDTVKTLKDDLSAEVDKVMKVGRSRIKRGTKPHKNHE